MYQPPPAHRCLRVIQHLNVEHGWYLTLDQEERYAQRIAALIASDPELSDELLSTIAENYYRDAPTVEALLDEEHPEHAVLWRDWMRKVQQILLSSGSDPSDPSDALSDFVQDALIDLYRGLGRFTYRSRFATWVYTVVSRSGIRHHRTLQAQKRVLLREARSLDELADTGISLHDPHASPDRVVLGSVLRQQIDQVLAQQEDRRLVMIVKLWLDRGDTLREIGGELHLSVTRVHMLLEQARALLRASPALRAWLESTLLPPASSEDRDGAGPA